MNGLFPMLFAGFIVYLMTDKIAIRLVTFINNDSAKIIAVSLISFLIVFLLIGIAWSISGFVNNGNNINALILKITSVLEDLRDILPAFIVEKIPPTALSLQEYLVDFLKEHGKELGTIGKEGIVGFAHVFVGVIVGVMVAIYNFSGDKENRPLSLSLQKKIKGFSFAFEKVVFAQFKISLINTILTAIFLAVILPSVGVHLPYVKSMILLTFIFGMLPVVGNLMSNIIIVTMSLGYSVVVAMYSLIFLIVIHKLEYFINAKIVGTQIKSSIWELLIAMVVMESIFGMIGLIAAPIYYAYIKSVLSEEKLV